MRRKMFRKLWSFFVVILLAMTSVSCSMEQKRMDPEEAAHEKRMEWWRDAKFGMFIHWGVYSDLAGVWKGKAAPGYSEHIFRSRKIPLETYKKEVAANFNPTKFDAEEWVKLCKQAGMKYIVITAKHHDGFAMFDTNVKGWEDYDVVDGTKFKRDPMVELKKACDKYGIKFGFYYSHAQDWSHPYGQRNTWDFHQPAKKGEWFKDPKWAEHREKTRLYVEGKSIPQLKELLSKKYDPDIIWFDTASWLPPEYLQEILTVAREVADPKVIFNSRSGVKEIKDYQSTCDRPAEFPPQEGDWEAIPTTNESYGYHKMDKSHKPVIHFVRLLSKASARGGNLLMNIGPKGDGTIDAPDVKILKGIGKWMDVNGEAIYGTERTTLPVHAWGESTIKGNILYLHIHNYPADNQLVVGGLKTKIKKVWALADKQKKALKFETLNSGDTTIYLPAELSKEMLPVLAVQCDGPIECDSTRLISPTQRNRFHVFDGQRVGDLRYGPGKERDSYVRGWKNEDDYMLWRNRIETPATFDVFVEYDAKKEDGKNTYVVRVGNKTFKQKVKPGVVNKRFRLGEVTLDKGTVDIMVKADSIQSKELFLLRTVILEPVQNTHTSDQSTRDTWTVDSQQSWTEAKDSAENLEIKDGQVKPTQASSLFSSVVKQYDKKRKAQSITFKQSPVWENWKAVPNVGPKHAKNAPVFIPVGDKDYWFLAQYNNKKEKSKGGKKVPAYHAWHSTDMVNWTHCGPVTSGDEGVWVTSAEYKDGMFYIYSDCPNDHTPHLFMDDDLADGVPGTLKGMVFNNPTHGSDCSVFRDDDGLFHMIYEDWTPIDARANSWDSPLAGHTSSADGITGFEPHEHPPVVDHRTTPTGETGTYKAAGSHRSPEPYFNYEIHKPEQDAFGDWTTIKIGSQYYLFSDYDKAGSGMFGVARWTSDSIYKEFDLVGELATKHPDPTCGFAEGQFYLITQGTDFTSPGPWVDGVEARVGVDTSGNGMIDQWTDWQLIKENYRQKPGFVRVVETTPAAIDLQDLPAGLGFKFEYKTKDIPGQEARPIMDRVSLSFQ